MNPGWRIICYHDVIEEETEWTRWIGVNVTPDRFREHLDIYSEAGELISVQEGLQRLRDGDPFEKPSFSVWFDDGFVGVRKTALPILKEYGVTSALAICSDFVERKSLFWRCKMSWLYENGHGEELDEQFSKLGCPAGHAKVWTVRQFIPPVLEIVEDTFFRFASKELEAEAFELFDDAEGIGQLVEEGWLVQNHTSSHLPITGREEPEEVLARYERCERTVEAVGGTPGLWAVPFDPGQYPNDPIAHLLPKVHSENTWVRVLNRANGGGSLSEANMLYRFMPSPPQIPNPLPLPGE